MLASMLSFANKRVSMAPETQSASSTVTITVTRPVRIVHRSSCCLPTFRLTCCSMSISGVDKPVRWSARPTQMLVAMKRSEVANRLLGEKAWCTT